MARKRTIYSYGFIFFVQKEEVISMGKMKLLFMVMLIASLYMPMASADTEVSTALGDYMYWKINPFEYNLHTSVDKYVWGKTIIYIADTANMSSVNKTKLSRLGNETLDHLSEYEGVHR